MEVGLDMAVRSTERLWQSMSICSNNLACDVVPGYRASHSYVKALGSVWQQQGGQPSDPGFDMVDRSSFVSGTLKQTGRELDVAVDGPGWLVVRGDGEEEGLTRGGALVLTATGELLAGPGLPLVGTGGVVTLPEFTSVAIGADGTVSVVPRGGTESEVVTSLRLVNPPAALLKRGVDGLFRMSDGSRPAVDASVKVAGGVLEQSNVNAVEQYLALVSAGRNMDVHVRLLRSFDQVASRGNEVLRPSHTG